ncbi:MAG TPA: ABC transporter substrate-binding protein, partial [Phycisphaerae bacterium]|nr:ABC transporter substrate-binding protein [Phycisphaerae bacterium]
MSNSNAPQPGSGLTGLGKFFSFLLVVGLIGLGGWIVFRKVTQSPAPQTQPVVQQTVSTNPPQVSNPGTHSSPDVVTTLPVAFPPGATHLAETQTEVKQLAPPMPYLPKGNTIDIELSKYAGYAGLIAANGGLEPNDNSIFAKKYGFKLRIALSEEESWDELNTGKMAASATTTDVLAVYGRQFHVVVPAQIGYSRGADGLVVRNDIRKVNDLKGKIVVASQFTESDFFIRYLAKEAGMPVSMLASPDAEPDAAAINLLYTDDGEAAGKFFVEQLNRGSKAIAGCVTWAPFTTEIPEASKGKAKLLVSNKNLLIIADILVVNQEFAQSNPKIVQGLVDGLLAGNQAVRDNPEANADVIGKAFKWDHAETLDELKKVHLSNLPEQLAFFNAGISQGGSFASIYQSALLAYGSTLIPNPADSDRVVSLESLKGLDAAGTYKDQVAAIKPLP